MAGGRLRDRADTSIRRRLSSRVSLVVLALFLLVAGACGSDAADEAAPTGHDGGCGQRCGRC